MNRVGSVGLFGQVRGIFAQSLGGGSIRARWEVARLASRLRLAWQGGIFVPGPMQAALTAR
ncbi:hypothetical protein BHK69_16830 [Bosea vaviloviae]|uniref:Uncharacterized protein n=1 Tax=Bosea vaviloviae TaxID=1526658 RepID=A0A1D7U3E8_9HYPH|nr:hypothetical protein BHK69_16830 [Bosea vaviloviae]